MYRACAQSCRWAPGGKILSRKLYDSILMKLLKMQAGPKAQSKEADLHSNLVVRTASEETPSMTIAAARERLQESKRRTLSVSTTWAKESRIRGVAAAIRTPRLHPRGFVANRCATVLRAAKRVRSSGNPEGGPIQGEPLNGDSPRTP